jgi:ribonucleoside-diphosphate reductase alpha chain
MMSALGKHVLDGDFDANGQMVVQSPSERVLERSVVVTRTVETKPAPAAKPAAQPDLLQDGMRHNGQPPLPYPLAPRPKPSDLTLDRARDSLLTPFGKATLTDRYLMPGESCMTRFPPTSAIPMSMPMARCTARRRKAPT